MSEDRIENLLEEILIWTKVGMYSSVKTLIREEFQTASPEKQLAYELLDGTRSQKEIVESCKNDLGENVRISNASLSGWINTWEKFGLLQKEGNTVTKNFSLTDFGFNESYLK